MASKSKLQITSGKSSKVRLGALTSSKALASSKAKPWATPATPMVGKKDYSKKKPAPDAFGVPSFGLTGLTGES